MIRAEENKILTRFLNSNRAEFMAVYGRRRVGKTFLIQDFFSHKKSVVFFYATGIQKGTYLEQRAAFCSQISKIFYGSVPLETPANWFKVFELLDKSINQSKTKKIVLFFDEFPWMSTPRSRLLQALEYFWNQHWSHNKQVKLIICGSLASWIMKNIINNTGGLYNRVTYRLSLEPLNLAETKTFLKENGINLTHHQIVKLYFTTGGIPLYLEQIEKGMTANQIINKLCFSKNGLLTDEAKELFKSLFSESTVYMSLTREIAKHRHGISKSELAKKLNISQSGRLLERLQELEDAGFIISFLPYQHKEKGTYFRIIDEYTLFYFQWIEPHIRSIRKHAQAYDFWTEQAHTQRYKTWCGYAFESICYKHINQIREKLKLRASSLPYSWRFVPPQDEKVEGAQIDLLFDREDDAITLCEIKYTETPFVIDKEYAERLKKRVEVFKEKIKTRKHIFISFISASGIKMNKYTTEIVDNTVILDDLFK